MTGRTLLALTAFVLPACAGALHDDLERYPSGRFAEGARVTAAASAPERPAPAAALPAAEAPPVAAPAPGPITPEELATAGVPASTETLAPLADPAWRPDGKLSRTEAEAAFLARSPALAAAAQRYRASFARYGQVHWLDALVRQYDAFAGKRRLDFPLRDAGALKGELVDVDVALARARFEQAVLDARAGFVQRFHEAYYWQRAVGILAQTVELSERVVDAADARYRAGRTSHANLIQAEIRLEDLRQRLRTARARRTAARLDLAAALDLPVDALEARSLTLAASLPSRPDRDATRAAAVDRGPTVAAARLRVRMAELMVQLAERQLLPDLRRADTSGRGDLRYATGGPFVDELRLRAAAARDALAQAERAAVARADRAWVALDQGLRDRYSTALTQLDRAELGVEVAERGYGAGTATFFDLDAAVQRYLQIALRARAAQRDAFVAAARLDAVTGLAPPAEETP